ncbi:hypothetical protein ACTA71_008409 [Dictyostelium dimigraforme]
MIAQLLDSMKSLEIIAIRELCDCALEYLDITPFLNLRILLLANNKFKLLSNIIGLGSGGLSGSNSSCQQLFALDLRNNQSDSISDMKILLLSLSQLSVIGLSGNGFTKSSASQTYNYRSKFLALITPLSQSHLYPLSMLDSNEITPDEINDCQPVVESRISSLNGLKALDLRNNRLKDLSTLCKIIDLLNIETLFIEENSCFEKDAPKDRINNIKSFMFNSLSIVQPSAKITITI